MFRGSCIFLWLVEHRSGQETCSADTKGEKKERKKERKKKKKKKGIGGELCMELQLSKTRRRELVHHAGSPQ